MPDLIEESYKKGKLKMRILEAQDIEILTDWEVDFLEYLLEQVENGKTLTEKQEVKLSLIEDEAPNRVDISSGYGDSFDFINDDYDF